MLVQYSYFLLLACYLVSGSKSTQDVAYRYSDESNSKGGSLKTRKEELQLHVFDNVNNRLILDNFTDVWNPYILARLFNQHSPESFNVSSKCGDNIMDYTAALSTGERWALKMADATGKYTWGLLSGNMFWLGSVDQCRHMQTEFIKWKNDKTVASYQNLPPFLVSMSSVNLLLKSRRIELNETYNIIFGLCLPDSCNPNDVKKLLYLIQDERGNDSTSEIVIQRVRNLSKGYSLWGDPVFYVLFVTFAVVIVVVVLGTFYDISLRNQVLLAQRRNQGVGDHMTEMKILKPVRTSNSITITELWSVKDHNATIDVQNSNTVPKPLSEALLSFSLLLNLSKLFSLDVGADTLAPIHGLRFLSMTWVVLVHTCLTVNVVSEGKLFRLHAEKDFFYQTISNGTYAVDTFFFISGCLVSFLYFRTITKDSIQKKKMIKSRYSQVLQFIGMVLYRYLRLTVPYLLVIGLIQVSSSWYYDHTMLDLYTYDYENCRKFWWRNALYINTYFAMNERCIIWSWYLANDTQFYLIGIILLIIGSRYLSVAGVVTILFLVASWITTAVISISTEHIASVEDPFAHYESLYDKPWSRIGPYLLGMMVGCYLYKSDCKIRINKTLALVFWIISFAVLLCIVYGLYGNMMGPLTSAAYTALSHSGWAICIGWILIACVTGHGLVNDILSWKYLYPLSRLSYCVYLVHPAIMRAVMLFGEDSMRLSLGLMAILFIGFIVSSYVVSFFLSLFFEAPMVSLLRIAHPMRSWEKTKY